MDRWVNSVRNRKGVALPLALFALVMLSGLLLAFLSMAGMESTISANLSDVTRARYIADAGIEWAFDRLATTVWNSSTGLGGTPVTGTNPPQIWLTTPANTGITLPGLTAAFGTFTATIRNDIAAGDTALTGLPSLDGSNSATNDTNGAVIVTASGTYNGMTRTIQVVLRRVPLPPFPGAFNMPGVQADLLPVNSNFDIDGRDYVYTCTANCGDPNPNNRTYSYSLNSDQSKRKYGIAVQPGYQANLGSGTTYTYEQRAEYRLDTPPKLANVHGKDQTNPGASTTGLKTVAPDGSLNPAVMQTFLTQLAQFSGTTVLQSTMACPMIVAGNASDPSKPQLTNGCGMNQTLDLGSKDKPRLVYFRGELDTTSAFVGLRTQGQPIKGVGILVVEDSDLLIENQLDWDGVVIVTGRYASVGFQAGGSPTVYGATVMNETIWDEAGTILPMSNSSRSDAVFQSNNTTRLRHSQQALDLVQRALLFRVSSWREL